MVVAGQRHGFPEEVKNLICQVHAGTGKRTKFHTYGGPRRRPATAVARQGRRIMMMMMTMVMVMVVLMMVMVMVMVMMMMMMMMIILLLVIIVSPMYSSL